MGRMKRFASKEEWSEAAPLEEVDSLSLVPVCVSVSVWVCGDCNGSVMCGQLMIDVGVA